MWTIGIKLWSIRRWCLTHIDAGSEFLTSGPCITWWRHNEETHSALLDLCARSHHSPIDSLHKEPVIYTFVFSLTITWMSSWAKGLVATPWHPCDVTIQHSFNHELIHFYRYGFIIIPVWMSNLMHRKVWNDTIYPFPNFNGAMDN